MNKKELRKAIIELPVDCSGLRPKIDKLTTLELVKLLDEPEKAKVPWFVADWIEKCKMFKHFVVSLSFALQPIVWEENNLSDKCIDWLMDANNQEIFARAWLDGYTVEKEKRYRVKLKSNSEEIDYLVNTKTNGLRFYSNIYTQRREHTRKELEEAGFGWVFDCEGIEIEEVKG